MFSIIVKRFQGRPVWRRAVVPEHGLNVLGVKNKKDVPVWFQTVQFDNGSVLLVHLPVRADQIAEVEFPCKQCKNHAVGIEMKTNKTYKNR